MNAVSNRSTRAGLFALIFLWFVSSGCAFLKPAESESRYYLLTSEIPSKGSAAHNKSDAGKVVRILPVDVANYLQNRSMAVRAGTNEVVFALFHQWAEPLSDGVRRVLAQDLVTLPGIRAVLTDQSAPAGETVYSVSVHVLQCEGMRGDSKSLALFKAEWEITGPGLKRNVLSHGTFQAPKSVWHAGDYDELANELSRALAGLSRALNQAISSENQNQSPPDRRG